eukprot:10368683-Karenia_brevis.AAC.1
MSGCEVCGEMAWLTQHEFLICFAISSRIEVIVVEQGDEQENEIHWALTAVYRGCKNIVKQMIGARDLRITLNPKP